MAGHSRYFAAILAHNMTEVQDGKVVLPDVSKGAFQLAMKFLEDNIYPRNKKRMKICHVATVGRIYTRFEMTGGLRMTAHMVENWLYAWILRKPTSYQTSKEIFYTINLVSLAVDLNLFRSVNAGLRYLREYVLKPDDHPPLFLTEEHINKCKPLILAYPQKLLLHDDDFSVEQVKETLFAPYLILKFEKTWPGMVNISSLQFTR